MLLLDGHECIEQPMCAPGNDFETVTFRRYVSLIDGKISSFSFYSTVNEKSKRVA